MNTEIEKILLDELVAEEAEAALRYVKSEINPLNQKQLERLAFDIELKATHQLEREAEL
jgi:hypothetical protein|tara:strand:+ start:870 stop:1046 length:177 start_codon:yes stop_codon:yes gene_type:complete